MLKIDIIFSFPFPKAMLRGMTDSALRTPFHHLPSFLSHWTPLFQTFITLCPGLWVELCPPKLYAQVLTLHTCERTSFGNTVIYAQVLTLHTCERTLFGNMVFEDTIKLKWSHTGLSSVQSLTRVPLFVTPWIAACQASLSITNSWSSLKLMSIELVMLSSHLILCRPLLFLLPILPSIRVFSNESTLCMRWPKYWSFSFSIIPSKEHPGLTSFRMDWLDPLQSQGLSRVFSNTTGQKHQFFGTQLSSQSNSHIHTRPLEKP